MKFAELILLLPCHGLEDFPIHHEGDDAAGLLAAWSAVWHPALLTAAGQLPKWHRADAPPDSPHGKLFVIPRVAERDLLAGFADRAKSEGACVLRGITTRNDIARAALAELDGGGGGVSDTLAADFYALGYCYLQVELLTRRMRYMSAVDSTELQNRVLAAAEAALRGHADETRDKLASCFGLLNEGRAHFYPVDAYLVDLTLVAPTTIGESLRRELRRKLPMNLLITAETLQIMTRQQPETLAELRAAHERGHVALVGGEWRERELPLLSLEAVRSELECGIAEYERLLARRPDVFGRRTFGLSTALPQVLRRLGFTGALDTALDDGRFPSSLQNKTQWDSPDGSGLDALGRPPLDASLPATLLALNDKLGHTMDSDHVATVCFAHWPGQTSEHYRDLERMAAYAPALGRFVTLRDYFRTTDQSGQTSRFEPDEYRSPYLQQAVGRQQADPISSVQRYHRRRAACDAAAQLSSLAALIRGKDHVSQSSSELRTDWPEILEHAERTGTTAADFDTQLDAGSSGAMESFVAALPRDKALSESRTQRGILLANPLSFTRRFGLDVSSLPGLPRVGGPVLDAVQNGERREAIVDVPPLGFAWIAADPQPSPRAKPQRKPPLPIARDNVLANDLMQATINEETGGIQSLHDLKRRGNRLSQQIALRIPTARSATDESWSNSDDGAIYTVMAADEVRVTQSSQLFGEITSRGRLMHPEGRIVGTFRQTFRLWQGSRILNVDVELDPREPPQADPWNSYFAARFAWQDDSAELFRSVHQGRQRTDSKRLEAPWFVEIAEGDSRTAILSGGLPYHRRIGARRLDTLLIVRNETARQFRLGIGIDLPNLPSAAIDFLTPFAAHVQTAPPPAPVESGWLFHFDVKNVVVTHLSPLTESGGVVGFRARLLETEGKSGRIHLRCFRTAVSAQETDFLGQPVADLAIEQDRIAMDYTPHKFWPIEARWVKL